MVSWIEVVRPIRVAEQSSQRFTFWEQKIELDVLKSIFVVMRRGRPESVCFLDSRAVWKPDWRF